MNDMVRLRIRQPPSFRTFEFCVPLSLSAKQATSLVAQLMPGASGAHACEDGSSRLLLLDGKGAGRLLGSDVLMEDAVRQELLCDGSLLALL